MNLADAAEIVYVEPHPEAAHWWFAKGQPVFRRVRGSVLLHGTEADWHASRQKYLTASNVPVVMGKDRYVSPYTLARQYLGDVPREPMNPMNALFAHEAEVVLSKAYEMETGYQTIDPGEYTMFISEQWPWMAATPDRLATDGKHVWNVQCKAPYEFSKKGLEQDGLPERVIVQVHAEMMCLGLDRTDVLIFFYGDRNPLRIVTVERNEQLVEQIANVTMEFWEKVQNGELPEIDGSESTAQTLKYLHPDDNGKEIILDFDALLLDTEYMLADLRVRQAKENLDNAQKAFDVIRNKLRNLLGPNTYGRLPNAVYTLKTVEVQPFMNKGSKYRKLVRKERD